MKLLTVQPVLSALPARKQENLKTKFCNGSFTPHLLLLCLSHNLCNILACQHYWKDWNPIYCFCNVDGKNDACAWCEFAAHWDIFSEFTSNYCCTFTCVSCYFSLLHQIFCFEVITAKNFYKISFFC